MAKIVNRVEKRGGQRGILRVEATGRDEDGQVKARVSFMPYGGGQKEVTETTGPDLYTIYTRIVPET